MGQQLPAMELAAADEFNRLGTQRGFPRYVRLARMGLLLLILLGTEAWMRRFHD